MALAQDWRPRLAALLADPRRRVEAQVFVAGAGIMVLEMLGGRLLAPRFGSTVFTWGALIGVVMVALTLGYAGGGRLADRWPHGWVLAALLLGGGAFALLMPFFAPLALAGIAGLLPDPRTGPLVASLVLIAPPSAVLGAATPVAVRLAAGPAERAGSVAGHMASVATVGSIVGTFGTVFVLIPAFDVATILTGAGAMLGLAALMTREHRGTVALSLAFLVVLSPLGQVALAPALTALQTGITDEVVYHKSTPYHELYVTDDRNPFDQGKVRTLILDGNRHSAMYTLDPAETPIRYIEHFHLGPLLNPNATRALFIGGGGFSSPKQFLEAYPNMTLDVAEIDGDVVDAAKRFFAVPEDPRLRIHVLDGRQFLARSGEARWDVVILDAYGRNYVPFHLMTAEFLSLVRAHLAPGGIVVSNVIGSSEGPTSQLLRAEARTFEATFGWVQPSFTHPEYTTLGIQNVLLLAAAEEPPGLADARARAAAWDAEKGRRYGAVFSTLGSGGLRTDDVPILTDAFAPVEAYISPLTGRPYDPEG